jgi:hypothetical protein
MPRVRMVDLIERLLREIERRVMGSPNGNSYQIGNLDTKVIEIFDSIALRQLQRFPQS